METSGVLEGKRIAIIGVGSIGSRHIDAASRLGATSIVVTDAREESIAKAKSAFPSIEVVHSIDEILETKPDILVVATHGPSHADIVVKAAAAKIGIIFCEKPIATSLRDAQTMIDAAQASGSRLFVDFTMRAFPEFHMLKTILANDIVGSLRAVSVTVGKAPGLGLIGSHYMDMMRFISGSEVVDAWGRLDTTGTPQSRGPEFKDPGGYGVFTFKNGVRGFIDMSEDMYGPHLMRVVGERGHIDIDVWNRIWRGYSYEYNYDSEGPKPPRSAPYKEFAIEVPPAIDLTEGIARAYTQVMRPEGFATGLDGYRSLEMIMALYASDRNGNTLVTFPLVGDDVECKAQFT